MELVIPRPNEKQKQFLNDHHKYVAFGGARGGGKSWSVRVKAVLAALKYPGITITIIRKSYPELIENHIKPLKEMCKVGTRDAIARYNDGRKEMDFINGSTILFKYCNVDKDIDQYQGFETDLLFIDEACLIKEEHLRKITACMRGVNTFPKQTIFTCNPGGISHGYIKRLFIDRHYNEGEHEEDYSFIKSLVTDNKALMKADPTYIQQLEALPEKLKQAWLYGDWNVFSGQFFEEFVDDPEHYEDRQWTHVIDPFEIPRDWKLYMSYDFGYSRPFSFGWWAVDYEGVVYRIAELYGCTREPNEGVKWTADEQFRKVREIESQHPLLKGRRISGRVADPAIWDASRGESVEETAAKHHIFFTKGDNARINGWQQFHYRLSMDENGYPMMYVFKTCKAFIRTVPLMIYSETHVEDLDTSLEDHACDEARYFLMDHIIKPRVTKARYVIGEDPLNQRIDYARKRAIIHE